MKFQFISSLATVCGLTLTGCAGSNATAPVATATAEATPATVSVENDEAANSLKEHHRHHHGAGVASFIALSLDTLGTDPDKPEKAAQIKQIQDDLNAQLAPAHAAEKNLMNILADGIAAGQVDKAKADDAITQIGAAAGGVHDANAETLNKLHAILSPAERATLVEKVRSHWEVWRNVNHEAEAGGKEEGGHLAAIADELSMTADQVDKLSGALKTAMADLPGKFDHKEAGAHVEAFATAFVADSFDAKSLSTAKSANGHVATHGATRMALFYETVAPLLTPEQRTKLAEHMHEHMTHQQATAGR